MAITDNKVFSFGEFDLEPKTRSIRRSGMPVNLSAKAFDLLAFFVENPGRPVTKDEILDTVWKNQFVEQSNLTVQIHALRKALGDTAAEPRFLATIPGKGYQFVAAVSRRNILEEISATAEPVKAIGPFESSNAVKKNRRRYVTGAACLSIVVVAAAFWYGRGYFFDEDRISSLAVLPFANQTGDPAADYLANGVAESIIFTLSRVPKLKVLSRDTTFRFRDRSGDAAAIGRELGVAAILNGRVMRAENGYNVSAELISTRDNVVIWGEQFARETEDVEKLQGDIARAIARGLQLSLTPADEQRLVSDPTDDHEAYQFYLTGRYHLGRLTDDGFLKARDGFQAASIKDPSYALAFAGLAESYNLLSGWGAVEPNDGFPLAKAAALRALELDEGLAEGHTQLGIVRLFYDFDWKRADAEFTRAIELNPGLSDAHHMYSYTLMTQGRFAEADKAVSKALELDPLSLLKIVSKGNVYLYERKTDLAAAQYSIALQMDPNSGLAHWSMGNALIFSEQYGEAIRHLETAIMLSGDSPDEPVSLALAHARSGNINEARRIAAGLEERAKTNYVPPCLFAILSGGLGDLDKAFEHLERAVRQRDAILIFIKVDPLFDPLRSDPRFPDLLKRLDL